MDRLMIVLYNIVLLFAAVVALPYYGMVMLLTGKYRQSLGRKFGFGLDRSAGAVAGRPRIWVHAVSVGEVTAAAPIVAALRESMPGACIIASTSTETGRTMARNLMGGATALIYYPLDFPFCVKKILDWARPDVVVLTETELWPNFIAACHRRRIKVVMVNGRISPRSFKRYCATRFFWRLTLRHIEKMAMISATDAERIMAIGMSPERVSVLGNAKYDGLAARVSPALAGEIAGKLGIGQDKRVLVAGSTHEGEEQVILDVYGKLRESYPDMLLIIVPRHIDRGKAVLEMVRSRGYGDAIAMTEIDAGRRRRGERIIVVDVIGELFKIYSLATVVFCGGSLVPKGGQNILEAAAWGKIVFYGPSMEDFLSEKKLLEEIGAGVSIGSGQELLTAIGEAMKDPVALAGKGQAAREAIAANRGSAVRYAEMVRQVLEQ